MTLDREAIRARFEAEGITFREWAKANGFNPRTVYAVLSGQVKCKRGISHDIAVALGIKAPATGQLTGRRAA